jgi:hypothetical protein
VLPAALRAGTLVVEAALVGPGGTTLDRATPRALFVAPHPSPLAASADGASSDASVASNAADASVAAVVAVAVWAPPDEPATLAFLRRWGIAPAASPTARPLLALIGNPERLRERLGDDDWLALWHGVSVGGAAIVLAPDPARDAISERFGTARGVRTLASLPEPVTVSAAAGNFMARVHVTREDGAPRLLGRGDEVLSPTAMLVSPLPEGSIEHLITLGFVGNRMGAPDASLPLGRGRLHVIGLPLLAELSGRVEPRRDARLAGRLEEVAEGMGETMRAGGAELQATPYQAPPTSARDEFGAAWARLDRMLGLSDRASPFQGGAGQQPGRPAALERALQARSAALADMNAGITDAALERIVMAAEGVWTPSTDAFLEAEARVLEQLGARVTAAGWEDWDRAYDGLAQWVVAVTAFQAGRPVEAREALERAAASLGDA